MHIFEKDGVIVMSVGQKLAELLNAIAKNSSNCPTGHLRVGRVNIYSHDSETEPS